MQKNITASLIKTLRMRTGAGFLECKRALLEENGDIERSIDNLRKFGNIRASKKFYNPTNHGVIFCQIENNIGVMLELNCETDFVSKDALFLHFGKNILTAALKKNIHHIDGLKEIFENKRIELVSQFGENININRFYFMKGENILSYVHGVRIGVLINANICNHSILKNIAMHIAASKPIFISPQDISDEIFQREQKIQTALVQNLKKSPNILNKIIKGRMNKFCDEISLTNQNFVMDPTKKVQDILTMHNIIIHSFIRFELGERAS